MNGPTKLLLAGTLTFGLPLLLITPPFASPDEPAHLLRAWAISEGRWVADRDDEGSYGAWLPDSVTRFLWAAGDFAFRPTEPHDPSALASAWKLRHDESFWRFHDFRNALQIPVLLYLPQAAACAVGDASGLRPMMTFYVARMANLVAATALFVWILGRLPAGGWWVTALALSPMALALRASLSPDALQLAILTAWFAELARLAWSSESPGRASRLSLLTLAVAVGLTRPVFLPLLLAALLVPALRSRWTGVRTAIVAIACGLLAAAAHLSTLEPVQLRWDVERNHAEFQIRRLASEPLEVASTLIVDLVVHSPRYAAQALGHRLGWLDVPVSLPAIALIFLGLLLLVFVEPSAHRGLRPGTTAALALLAAASALLIELVLWIQWTPPEYRGVVEGVQGRYLLPLAIPLAAALRFALPDRFEVNRNAGTPARLAILVVVISGCSTLYATLDAYWF